MLVLVSEKAEMEGVREPGGPVCVCTGKTAEVPARFPVDTANDLFPGEASL